MSHIQTHIQHRTLNAPKDALIGKRKPDGTSVGESLDTVACCAHRHDWLHVNVFRRMRQPMQPHRRLQGGATGPLTPAVCPAPPSITQEVRRNVPMGSPMLARKMCYGVRSPPERHINGAADEAWSPTLKRDQPLTLYLTASHLLTRHLNLTFPNTCATSPDRPTIEAPAQTSPCVLSIGSRNVFRASGSPDTLLEALAFPARSLALSTPACCSAAIAIFR